MRGEGTEFQRQAAQAFCLQPLLSPRSIAAGRLSDGFTFVVYEFWETEEEWKR